MRIFLILFISFSANALTTEQCKSLDELIGKINNKKLYNFSSVNKILNLSRSTKCDDGAYAENMSNIVAKSLVMDYVRTIKVAGKNQNATNFVIGHISETSERADLVKIVDNSLKICPEDKKNLCKKIESIARKGIN